MLAFLYCVVCTVGQRREAMKETGEVPFPGKEPEFWEEITRLLEVNLKILRSVYTVKSFYITIRMLVQFSYYNSLIVPTLLISYQAAEPTLRYVIISLL
jgi:hypothetical protein